MNFEDTDFRHGYLNLNNPFDVKLVSKFLAQNGFEFKPDEVEKTLIIYNLNDEIIGTGSYKNQTLKFVVVADKFRESTAFPLIVTNLSYIILQNHKRCFVFTKPETAKNFEALGFKEIARSEPLFVALEFGYQLIDRFVEELKKEKVETRSDNVSAIVVNCNPFTFGHLYLIEKAAAESELLYLFIVEENKSSFPYEVRKKIITEGVKHLKNVKIISSGPYIVSGAIFPNYFLKSESETLISQKQAELDIKIFAKYVVPALGIKKRYVGTENYCHTTRAYNEAMKKILPTIGCQVFEIERKAIGKQDDLQPNYISASKVRKAIREDNIESVMNFLPEVTQKFLISEEAKDIIEKIKSTDNRH